MIKYEDRFYELETIAKKRYIEKYSKKEYECDVEDNGIRDIVGEVLTDKELREYLKMDFKMNGDEHLFSEIFGDDDK
jgi:hypothetical protein